jgi:hypothetical protein
MDNNNPEKPVTFFKKRGRRGDDRVGVEMNGESKEPVPVPAGFTPVEEALPPPGERVIALCAQFRILAYRDSAGVWRDNVRKQPVKDVRAWQPVIPP